MDDGEKNVEPAMGEPPKKKRKQVCKRPASCLSMLQAQHDGNSDGKENGEHVSHSVAEMQGIIEHDGSKDVKKDDGHVYYSAPEIQGIIDCNGDEDDVHEERAAVETADNEEHDDMDDGECDVSKKKKKKKKKKALRRST